MTYQTIELEIRNRIGYLTLNRPDALNALNAALRSDLLDAVDQVNADPDCRCLLLTGAGRGFCAGADLTEAGQYASGDMGDAIAELLDREYNPLIRALAGLDKPVVTAVNGVAAGGGASLALLGDIVIAGRSATFVQVFGPQLGIVPDLGGTWLLPRLVGQARAVGLAMLGDKLSAEQAADWGLIWQCVDDDQLMATAEAIATRLANGPTKGLVLTRRILAQTWSNDLDAQLDLERETQRIACRSEDFMEGVAAFLQKRPPSFSGR